MTSDHRSRTAILAERWKLAASVIGFWVGISIFVWNGLLNPPIDPVTGGFALTLTGLGPAAIIDYLRKETS